MHLMIVLQKKSTNPQIKIQCILWWFIANNKSSIGCKVCLVIVCKQILILNEYTVCLVLVCKN